MASNKAEYRNENPVAMLEPANESPPSQPSPVTNEKLSMEVLSDEEHAAKYPRTVPFRIFNKLDGPQALDLCPGKMTRAFHMVDGVKQLNPNADAACRQCPGMHIARMNPRETRDVMMALPNCMGSGHINGQIRSGFITVRRVNPDGTSGEKITKFST
jgi:hypothetical protein